MFYLRRKNISNGAPNCLIFLSTLNPPLLQHYRLLLPNLSYRGTACLRFRYHMYGFHIGSLRVFVGSGSERHNVFQEVGEKGNFWLSAQINVQLNYNNEVIVKNICFQGISYCFLYHWGLKIPV